ncbi:MAG: hypothetical protein U0L76_08605 [Ruminococcus sp.]|nr:hypothetical protein [Ruminococcus sp.]
MKEKILSILKSNWLFAIVLNIMIMLFCIQITSFSYDDCNDFYNSLYICKNHFYYSNTINYILSTLIGSVQYAFSDFNCFVLAQILLSCVSFISITFVFADKYSKRKAFVVSVILNILFSLNHYSAIQSSKTSAVLLTAGFLLILNAVHNKRYNLPCWIGVTEIAFGSFLDYRYFFIALAFGIAFFIGDMISKRKYKIQFRKFFWYFRPFLLIFAFVILVVMGLNQYSLSVNHATDEASDYYEYASLTDSINNLPFPDYSDHIDEFNEIGISTESDYELLKNGYYDADKSLNIDALKLVSEIQQKENSKNLLFSAVNIFMDIAGHIVLFDSYTIIIFAFVIISVLFIILQKRRFAFFPFLYLFTGFISSLILRYYYSIQNYHIYGIWLLMLVFLLYSFNFEQLRPRFKDSCTGVKKRTVILSGLSIAFLLTSYSVAYIVNYNPINVKDKPQSLFSEIDRHPDRYYVLDVATSTEYIKYSENYMHPLWGFRDSFLENVDGFGYFHHNEILRKRNMSENIYEAVLTNNKIYVIDKNITFRKERYFTQNYAENGNIVTYNQVNDIDGFKIYEVTQN